MKVAVHEQHPPDRDPIPSGPNRAALSIRQSTTEFADWLGPGINLYRGEGVEPYAISPQNEPFFVQSFNSCWYKQEWYPEMLIGAISRVKANYPGVRFSAARACWKWRPPTTTGSGSTTSRSWTPAGARNNVDILAVHGYSDGVAPTSGSTLGHLWSSHKTAFRRPDGQAAVDDRDLRLSGRLERHTRRVQPGRRHHVRA